MFPSMMVGEHSWVAGCLWYFYYLSELLFSVVLLSISVSVFDSGVSLTVWISSPCFHHNVFNQIALELHFFKHHAVYSILGLSTSQHDHAELTRMTACVSPFSAYINQPRLLSLTGSPVTVVYNILWLLTVYISHFAFPSAGWLLLVFQQLLSFLKQSYLNRDCL